MADFVKVGGRTPNAAIYKSESHKLHQAFPVKEAENIVQGQPVKLNEDGTISAYTGAAGEVYLGIAVTYSKHAAYPPTDEGVEVTVMVEAFAVTQGIAKANITKTGYVKTDGTLDDSGIYANYESSDDETKFIVLNIADAGDLVRVLIR